ARIGDAANQKISIGARVLRRLTGRRCARREAHTCCERGETKHLELFPLRRPLRQRYLRQRTLTRRRHGEPPCELLLQIAAADGVGTRLQCSTPRCARLLAAIEPPID